MRRRFSPTPGSFARAVRPEGGQAEVPASGGRPSWARGFPRGVVGSGPCVELDRAGFAVLTRQQGSRRVPRGASRRRAGSRHERGGPGGARRGTPDRGRRRRRGRRWRPRSNRPPRWRAAASRSRLSGGAPSAGRCRRGSGSRRAAWRGAARRAASAAPLRPRALRRQRVPRDRRGRSGWRRRRGRGP